MRLLRRVETFLALLAVCIVADGIVFVREDSESQRALVLLPFFILAWLLGFLSGRLLTSQLHDERDGEGTITVHRDDDGHRHALVMQPDGEPTTIEIPDDVADDPQVVFAYVLAQLTDDA